MKAYVYEQCNRKEITTKLQRLYEGANRATEIAAPTALAELASTVEALPYIDARREDPADRCTQAVAGEIQTAISKQKLTAVRLHNEQLEAGVNQEIFQLNGLQLCAPQGWELLVTNGWLPAEQCQNGLYAVLLDEYSGEESRTLLVLNPGYSQGLVKKEPRSKTIGPQGY